MHARHLEPVTVIMPTLAKAERANPLRAALASVLSQRGVRPVPLIVVNGTERDTSLVRKLERTPGVRLIRREEAHLGDAIHAGRTAVDTRWFAELDDDDLLLPGALSLRLQCLVDSPSAGAVVSNGWTQRGHVRQPAIASVAEVAVDPMAALANGTWLLPGAALFRTDAVGGELFRQLPRYLEWTCLALRLARGPGIEFLDEMTFVHHEARPDGLWESPECVLGRPRAIRELLMEDIPVPLRKVFLRRLSAACNSAAIVERDRRRWVRAWHWHLRCLAGGGWRYLTYTRKLLPGYRAWRTGT